MKTKIRNGVSFKTFLAEELKDEDVRQHYERAKASSIAAQAVVKARRRAGLTQTELGQRIGSDQKSVWRLETGEQNTTVETLEKVAKATGSHLYIEMPAAPKVKSVKKVLKSSK